MPTRRIVVVVADDVQALEVAGPIDAFASANQYAARDSYAVTVASLHGGPVRSNSGLGLAVDAALGDIDGRIDTLLVPGGRHLHRPPTSRGVVDEVLRLAGLARRTCAVCTGAFVLAEAGLLDGRAATTHWFACAALAARFPAVRIEADRIFVRDGDVTTSAGVTAGIDLTLSLIEADLGAATARKVARWLVVFLQRPGGQSQFSERLRAEVGGGSPLRAALDTVVADPSGTHDVAELARRAAISERHLARLFAREVGMTPRQFVERVRVEAARDLLETTSAGLPVVAERVGFGSEETLRRAFRRITGVGPGEHRRRFANSLAPTPSAVG